ncbi:MAG: ABC transporter ATP-binding protein [Nitrososphaerota archaeon]|nr:ABC transporter ATP-binding protein [Nitrososphaerales archaeon]MDW8044621.1 ABC transporter ATP-binding protein [Nitrososphaerota archaeon]
MVDLRVEGLTTYFFTRRGIVKAVDNVSFNLRDESWGIAGESGCGKSTLGLSLLRLVPPPGRIVKGSMILDGEDLLAMDEKTFRSRVRWKKISMIFQGAMNALNPVYPIGYQLAEPLIYHYGFSKSEALNFVKDALKEVRLSPSLIDRYPHELSGGMKQRVVIAMALVLKPKIVVADEPTTALDLIVQAQIINLMKRLKWESKVSFILMTHDLSMISEIADKVAIMYAGKLVESGTSERLYSDPKHPYTQSLLSAIPRLRGGKKKLTFIPGSPPDLIDPPSGCRFHPRCVHALQICREREPPSIDLGDGTMVSCWLYEGGQTH